MEEMSEHIAYIDDACERDMPEFLRHRAEDVIRIRKHLEKRDFREIRSIGHALTGSGDRFGDATIRELGNRIKLAARAGNSDEIRHCTNTLQALLSSIRLVYTDRRLCR